MGSVTDSSDCDDGDAAFHPGAEETDCADPNDYNCDGSVGFTDGDGDGFAACEDCDDGAATVSPAAIEICDAADADENCNGSADDADATVDTTTATTGYPDADADAYGDALDVGAPYCDLPVGFTTDNSDCDDDDDAVYPGANEVCNGIDDNCDARIDDADPALDVTSTTGWYADSDSSLHDAVRGVLPSSRDPLDVIAAALDGRAAAEDLHVSIGSGRTGEPRTIAELWERDPVSTGCPCPEVHLLHAAFARIPTADARFTLRLTQYLRLLTLVWRWLGGPGPGCRAQARSRSTRCAAAGCGSTVGAPGAAGGNVATFGSRRGGGRGESGAGFRDEGFRTPGASAVARLCAGAPVGRRRSGRVLCGGAACLHGG